MKKFFYAMSLALVCGLTASAAVPMPKTQAKFKKINTASSIKAEPVDISDFTPDGKLKVKRNASAEDFYGEWQWSGDNGLTAIAMPNEGVMSISYNEANDSILITGFDTRADAFMGGLRGYVKDGLLYISNQITCPEGNYYEDEKGNLVEYDPSMFVNYTLRNLTPAEIKDWLSKNPGKTEEDAKGLGYPVQAPDGNEFHFQLTQSGALYCVNYPAGYTEDDMTDAFLAKYFCIAADVPIRATGYFWLCLQVIGWPVEYFEFLPSEWTYVGDASFTDCWANQLLEDPDVDPYPVPLYASKVDANRYMLLDPYGPDSPYAEIGLNASDDEGYLVFDLTNPECVVFEPFVYTFSMEFSDVGFQKMYCYNEEGYSLFIQGATFDQIIDNFDDRGYNLSEFKKSSRTVTVENPIMDIVPYLGLTSGYQFEDLTGKIVLPEGYDSAVETILGEDNAPVEYFNLQGVRVANPEKGQIVIVRKGDKATKQIAR